MDNIFFNDYVLGEALAALAGTDYNPKSCVNICRVRLGNPLGGVIFSNFTGESIVVHSASWDPYWLNRDMLYVVFDYPFNQLGVKRLFGLVPENNLHARRFNEKMGFKTVTRIEGMYRNGVACLVMRLDREDCRFLKVKPRTIGRSIH